MNRLTLSFTLMLIPTAVEAQTPYRKPPQVVLDILNAEPAPGLSLNPTRTHAVLVSADRYPPITDVAEPMLRLAGLRINPRTSGPHLGARVKSLAVMELGKKKKKVPLPEGKIGPPVWSPDGKHFAFTCTLENHILLYMYTLDSDAPKMMKDVQLNAAVGAPFTWMPDSKTIAFRTPKPPLESGRGAAKTTPIGPTVMESGGKAAPVRTYQDLLKNADDEALFDKHAITTIAFVTVTGEKKEPTRLDAEGVFLSFDPSPDGTLLLTSRAHKPYSYLYPISSFPKAIEVWDVATGKLHHTVVDKPLEDKVPIEGVPTGPRSIRWHPAKPRTLVWVEAQDGGDPKAKADHRDQVFTLDYMAKAPFTPAAGVKLTHRFQGLSFFENGETALVRDYDRERRWARTMIGPIAKEATSLPVLDERSVNDRYGNPGTPVNKTLPNGEVVLREVAGRLVLSGSGASPKGDRPFLDLWDVKTGTKDRIFECAEGVYETASVLTDDASQLLVRRESPTNPGNYFIRNRLVVRDGPQEFPITNFQDPAPILRQVKKQLVSTQRADGVTISFTLYLPPDYKEGTKLPAVVWAYPKEFNDAATAGQVSGSPYHFTTIAGPSPLFMALLGYAVLDEVSMPIVGPPETANDNFLKQLEANAKAAIDKASDMGVIDRNRVGVGGHSYGAFMTANLLAHTSLFKAGVARSGAYNRTLTPFGFQNERRTFWEAPQVYGQMSPFYHAEKIKTPLLLIHGEADNNPGTFPLQSERLYQAVRGNGGPVRLVLLPHESHGYAARESIEHTLAETIDWFDKYVKGNK